MHIDCQWAVELLRQSGGLHPALRVVGHAARPSPSGMHSIDGGLASWGFQIAGPPFKRLDFSTFKDFKLSERFSLAVPG